MPFEVLEVISTAVLAVGAFYVGAVTLDVVENILVLAQELCWVGSSDAQR